MPRRRPLAESLSAAVKDPAALKPSTKDSLTSRDCPCLFLATSWQTFYCVRLQLYEQLRGDGPGFFSPRHMAPQRHRPHAPYRPHAPRVLPLPSRRE